MGHPILGCTKNFQIRLFLATVFVVGLIMIQNDAENPLLVELIDIDKFQLFPTLPFQFIEFQIRFESPVFINLTHLSSFSFHLPHMLVCIFQLIRQLYLILHAYIHLLYL